MSTEFDAAMKGVVTLIREASEDLVDGVKLGDACDPLIALAILRTGRLLALAIQEHGAREPQETPPGLCDGLEPEVAGASIRSMTFSARPRKAMRRLGITTVGGLIGHTAEDLLECKNFGITGLSEVRRNLKEVGLYLRGEKPGTSEG